MPSLEENKGLFNKAHPPPSGVNASGGLFSSLHGQAGDFRKGNKKPWLDSHGSPPDAGEPRHVELRGGQIWKRHLEDSTFDGNLR